MENPRVRSTLLLEPVGDEALVYLPTAQSAYLLSSEDRRLFELCDGQHTISQLVEQSGLGRQEVASRLQRLEKCGILEAPASKSGRRIFLKAAAALPLLPVALLPRPAAAMSVASCDANCGGAPASSCTTINQPTGFPAMTCATCCGTCGFFGNSCPACPTDCSTCFCMLSINITGTSCATDTVASTQQSCVRGYRPSMSRSGGLPARLLVGPPGGHRQHAYSVCLLLKLFLTPN